MSRPSSALGRSVTCDCGISWSYSLAFWLATYLILEPSEDLTQVLKNYKSIIV